MAPHAIGESGTCGESVFPRDSPLASVKNLSQLLSRAASGDKGLIFYSREDGEHNTSNVLYSDLLRESKQKALQVRSIEGVSPSTIFLLHFDNHRESIEWFWAITLAGFLPVMSTPFVNDTAQRKKHLLHLQSLLNNPFILTTEHLVSEFLGLDGLRLFPINSLCCNTSPVSLADPHCKDANDYAVLMLTSGSTGNAKAVPLRHGQILTALQGKSKHNRTEAGDTFLNWVGMDHVACLTEIHLHGSELILIQMIFDRIHN